MGRQVPGSDAAEFGVRQARVSVFRRTRLEGDVRRHSSAQRTHDFTQQHPPAAHGTQVGVVCSLLALSQLVAK